MLGCVSGVKIKEMHAVIKESFWPFY